MGKNLVWRSFGMHLITVRSVWTSHILPSRSILLILCSRPLYRKLLPIIDSARASPLCGICSLPHDSPKFELAPLRLDQFRICKDPLHQDSVGLPAPAHTLEHCHSRCDISVELLTVESMLRPGDASEIGYPNVHQVTVFERDDLPLGDFATMFFPHNHMQHPPVTLPDPDPLICSPWTGPVTIAGAYTDLSILPDICRHVALLEFRPGTGMRSLRRSVTTNALREPMRLSCFDHPGVRHVREVFPRLLQAELRPMSIDRLQGAPEPLRDHRV